MKYKLIDLIKTTTRFYVEESGKNGTKRRAPIYLDPGVVYVTEDPLLIASLLGPQGSIKTEYRDDIERALKEAGIEYEVTVCKVCGGRKKKILYRAVEEVK